MAQPQAKDDWGDTPAAVKADPRWDWGDEQQSASPSPSKTETAPPSAGSRFWSGVKAGLSNENDPYIKADRAAHGIQDTGNALLDKTPAGWSAIPGSGVVRDIRRGNYAGAAGRILGPGAVIGASLLGARGGEEPLPTRPINVRGPGEILPEMPRAPRVYSPYERPPIAKPIPPRQGLLLEGAVNPGARLPERPTPELIQSGALREGGRSAPLHPSSALRNIPVKAETIDSASGGVSAPSAPPQPTHIQKPSWTPPRASQFNPIEIGGPEDVAETKDIQGKIRDQAEQETDALRKRGNEEGFARNTRPRIAKSEMAKNFKSAQALPSEQGPASPTTTPKSARVAKPSAKTSGKALSATGSTPATEDELLNLLEKSLAVAKAKKK